jgi:hypothetical protein
MSNFVIQGFIKCFKRCKLKCEYFKSISSIIIAVIIITIIAGHYYYYY